MEDELSSDVRFRQLLNRVNRNDPETTVADCVRDGYSIWNFDALGPMRELGEALTGNTHVTSLTLPIWGLRRAILADNDDLVPILRFIEASFQLHDIKLHLRVDISRETDENGDMVTVLVPDPAVVARFLMAISNNRSIRSLELRYLTPAYIDAFFSLMQTTVSLKKLVLENTDWGSTEVVGQRFAQALRCNTTLESLHLDCAVEQAPRPFARVLEQLQVHPRLEHLSVGNSLWGDMHSSVTDALSRCLPKALTHLELSRWDFRNQEHFGPLYQTLRLRASIVKLTLKSCSFGQTTTGWFQELLMPTGETGSAFRSLSLGANNTFDIPVGRILSNVFASCAKENMDLQLEEISVIGIGSHIGWVEMFTALEKNARFIALRSLSVHGAEMQDLNAARVCLPKLVHLKELRFFRLAVDNSQAVKDGFLNALRLNGSLLQVEMERSSFDEWIEARRQWSFRLFFTEEDELERVRTYCYRNKTLPMTLANPSLDGATVAGDNDNNKDGGSDKKVPLALCPDLLHRALQCHGTGPSVAFEGLVAISGTLWDSATAGKRKRTETAESSKLHALDEGPGSDRRCLRRT